MWCSGARASHCSPSERVSSGLSTCRLSHSCLLVGLTVSESSGGAPSAAWLTKPRTLWVSGMQQFLHHAALARSLVAFLKSNSFFCALEVPVFSGYSVSPDDGNGTSLQCCSMASEIFMKGM